MNYRHAYHAGNFADVLKHIVFTRCLAHLCRKDAPFRVIDTHAGAGLTRLDQRESAATGEWRGGIGQMFGPDSAPVSAAVSEVLAPYQDAVRAENPSGLLAAYPGSPLIARSMLRAGDKLIVNELHHEDGGALQRLLSHDKACKVLAEDGYQLLKSALPPPERRGLILIDPPFEEPGELIRMTNALAEGLSRFATGMYILWYPIKDEKHAARFHRGVAEVATAARIEAPLKIELLLRPPRNPLVLNGCGLVIINPPYTLHDEMALALPELAKRLGDQGKGSYLLGPLTPQA